MELKDKTFLVVGTGISGIAAAKLLAKMNAEIILFDSNAGLKYETVQEKLPDGLEFDLVLGELPQQVMDRVQVAVLSPGVPTDLPFVVKLQERKIPIWGEIELAYLCGKGRVFAITGTNGKTTTTALTGAIMKEYFDSVFVVGNIGLPYTEYVSEMDGDSVTVAEISSFQLETVHKFHPQVSAILNITPDHLNRHHTMECYVAAKANIAKNQTKEEVCILNYEDSYLQKIAADLPADVFWFSSAHILERGVWLEGEQIVYCDTEKVPICSIYDMELLGTHNYENVMAAASVTMALGVPLEKITAVLKTFRAVAHRIEYVDEIAGVRYYNDSKATNPDAAIQGIRAMERPTWLIGGGYDKQAEYGDWIKAFDGKVEKLVLLGETKEKIAKEASLQGYTDYVMCETLEEAVAFCHDNAKPGDAVLLSPACASWDMFPNFEKRGELFKELVHSFAAHA